MRTIRIVDLLVKIANGEEVPKQIIYKGRVREFDYEDKDYTCIGDTDYYLFHDTLAEGTGDKMVTVLNDEVEIIEDTPKEDKKIEKLDVVLLGQCDNWLQPTIDTDEKIRAELNPYIIDVIRENTLVMQRKINELIDKINELIDKINGEEK